MGIRSLAAELLPNALQGLGRVSFTSTATDPQVQPDSLDALTARLGYLSKSELKLVREAFKFADQAHLGQFRASGQPYITHPIAVASLCAGWRLDVQAIMAALMHDTIEDQGVTKSRADPTLRCPHRRPRRRPDQARPSCSSTRARRARPNPSARCCWRWRATCA